ncbi:unnamed protein product [Microthlaspi erraticum]|uniref:RNase H type-1 domain-containing protein n=1 Tax=Microthlaspi erraticum TaxID=1685480 RepID=A0A6D2I5M5_9BRAS|nr:unnamed protein product [Microthlaspi erraticum]
MARLVWSIPEFPTHPGIFPCDALYKNVDHLFWRAKEEKVPEITIARFPWILWYLWKARNDKVFNNKDISSLDTFQLACAESETWSLAQLVDKTVSDNVISSPVVQTDSIITASRCQTDASWSRDCNVFGGGFVLETANDERLFGAMAEYQVSTPLHAELAALVWAMTKALEQGITALSFETDCLQLVRIVDNEEDWPSMISELDEFHTLRSSFTLFSLSFIPRLLNVCADRLLKGARAQGFCFTHVDHTIPSWLVFETNLLG